MHPIFTVLVSIGAVLSTAAMGIAASVNEDDFWFLIFWTGAPYLGHCGLATSRRAHGTTVFAWTIISGGLATLFYWANFRPMIDVRQQGGMPMNCAGPLIEAGVPLIQWFLVMVLFLAIPGGPISDERPKGTGWSPEL
jgi:hypothetical protein